MSDFYKDKAEVTVNLIGEVVEGLKKYNIGDEIHPNHIFIKFKCGDYASRMIIEILETLRYIDRNDEDSGWEVIMLP